MAERKEYEIHIGGITESIKSTQSLNDALKEQKKEYKGAADALNDYNTKQGQSKKAQEEATNAQKSGTEALKEMRKRIKEIQGEMLQFEQGSKQWNALAKEAGDLKDKVKDAQDAINRFSSDTKRLDDVINVAKSATAAFELYKGAMSAFGMETEETEKAMQKLVGAMSIIQSLQTLQNTLKGSTATAELYHKALQLVGLETKTVAVAEKTAAASTTAMAAAENTATVATKGLNGGLKATKLALASLGIGLVIMLVSALVEHWEELVGWFTKTFPALKNLSGWFNKVRGTISGLIDAVWAVIKSFGSLGDMMKAIFSGEWGKAVEIAKQNIANITNAFKTGYADKMGEIEEEVTRKKAAEEDKQLTHHRNMITKQKNADGTYTKEYIQKSKEMFENRKKMYKKDSDEYRKVLEDEAAFNQQVEDAKEAAVKKSASERAKANKEAAKQAADAVKFEEETLKKFNEALKKLDDAFYKAFQAETKEDLRKLENELEKFNEGPIKQLVDTLYEIEDLKGEIIQGENTKAFNDLWNGLDENLKKVFGSVENLRKHTGYLSMEQVEAQEEVEKSFTGTTKAIKNQINAFRASIEEVQTSVKTIVKNTQNNLDELDRQSARKLADAYQRVANAQIKNAENLYKNFIDDLKNVDVTPVRNKITGIINEKETLKKFETVRNGWIKLQEDISNEIKDTEANWNQTIARLENLYTSDSQIYKDAVQAKIEALERLRKVQEDVAKRASTPLSLKNDYNADNKKDTPDYRKLWYGKDDKKQDGSEYSLIENLANLATELDEMVLGPAMDTFNMFMDFAIEETQKKLEEVQEMHDEALEKVESSTERIKELNDSLKDSSNTNIEVTKQQLADEQILYAQRLAEEQKLAQEEKNLQNKANEQEYKSRQMELGYQFVMAVANTAQGASKALAQWGWPLGPIFAGTMAALGAVQSALILKQMNALPKPRKLADGGLITGPSHKQGGIQVGRTGIEVEGGEAIINKRSTRQFLPLLDAINAAGNGGKHTLADKKIRKYANGGQLNFENVDGNLRQNAEANRILNAIDNINFQPQVAVVDINRVNARLTKVKSLAGR